MKIFILFFVFLIGKNKECYSQNLLDTLIEQNHYLIYNDSRFEKSSGIEFLKKELAQVQFIFVGENHNTDKIPEFVTRLFKLLHANYGFNYLACEQDPMMMSRLSNNLRFLNINNVKAITEKFPYGFTFCTDQEIKMLSDILQISRTSNSIWGCDQSYGIAHSLDAINNKDKRLDSFYKIARLKESVRDPLKTHFLSGQEDTDLMKYLATTMYKVKNIQDRYIYHFLLLSDTLYNGIRNKNYYSSRSRREDFMKERFLTEYKKALTKEKFPKALLKFGNNHIMYGFNTASDALSLGTFVRDIAKANNKTCISLNTLLLRKDSSIWDLSIYPSAKYLSYFTNHCDTANTHMIDLRPIRHFFYNGYLNTIVSPEFRKSFESLIFAFDFLVLIGNGSTGTYTISGSKSY